SQEIAAGNGTDAGGLYISTRGMDPNDFPQMQQKLLEDVGVDPDAVDREVAPGAHYFMGGLRIEPDASTSLPGVFAAGECSGGIHGANRLAGNALSENQVFGAIAGRSAAAYALSHPLPTSRADGKALAEALEPVRRILGRSAPGEEVLKPSEGWAEVQALMQRDVGATRTGEGLERALKRLSSLREELPERLGLRESSLVYNRDAGKALELRNMVDTGWSVAASALERRESRGAHVRLDATGMADEWACSLAISLNAGSARLRKLPRGEGNRI
ncbi:MAG: L-aspartate oxidase, partial [Paenibacillus sp.]|nr:L-aspartate oxidase [Paenibacillus sp.]